MIWIVLTIVFGLVALCSLFAALGCLVEDLGGEWSVVIGAVLLFLCAANIVGCVKSSIAASRDYGARSCNSFAEQTGYEVRYFVTSPFDSGGCFVRFDDRWVPKGQLWAELGSRS